MPEKTYPRVKIIEADVLMNAALVSGMNQANRSNPTREFVC